MPIFYLVIISLFVGLLGMNKKLGFWVYFLSSLVLTPFIGLLMVFASDKKQPKKK